MFKVLWKNVATKLGGLVNGEGQTVFIGPRDEGLSVGITDELIKLCEEGGSLYGKRWSG